MIAKGKWVASLLLRKLHPMHVDATMIICGALVYGVFVCEGVRVSVSVCLESAQKYIFISILRISTAILFL